MHIENETILPLENPLQVAANRERAADELGTARCPWCDAPLRMRMSCEGPTFVCACGERRAA